MGIVVSSLLVGKSLQTSGDLAGAKKYYEDALEVLRRLVQTNPDNDQWQSLLLKNVNEVSEFLKAEGDVAGVKKHYAEALDILRQQAQKERTVVF